jgi:hypothetical protein
MFTYFDRVHLSKEYLLSFEKILNHRRASRQNLFSNFVDLIFLANLPRLILQPSVASTRTFLRFFARAPCPFNVITKNFFGVYFLEVNLSAFSFSVEIPSWVGLSGPQLAAIPGLFGWESLDGWDCLGHNLLLSQASLGGNLLVDGIF